MTISDSTLTAEQLVERYCCGDDRAFDVLIERMMPMLRGEVARVCEKTADRDDLAQEALLALSAAAKGFSSDGGASFATFSRTCVRNRLLNAAKRLHTPESLRSHEFLYSQVDKEAKHTSQTPERWLINQEDETAMLGRLKKRLSELEYRVLILHLGSFSYREIGVALGISEKAVDNALQRIRRKLKGFF